MVQSCCVPFCKARARINCAISFHLFPRDAKRREIWLKSLKMSNISLSAEARVCSKHFDANNDYLFGTNVKKLRKCAVPVLNTTPAKVANPKDDSDDSSIGTNNKKIRNCAPFYTNTNSAAVSNAIADKNKPSASPKISKFKTDMLRLNEENLELANKAAALQKELEKCLKENEQLKASMIKNETQEIKLQPGAVVNKTDESYKSRSNGIKRKFKAQIIQLNETNLKLTNRVAELQTNLESRLKEDEKTKANTKNCLKQNAQFLTFDKLKEDNKTIFYYTGFKSFSSLNAIYNFLLPSYDPNDLNINWTLDSTKNRKITLAPKEQFLLTLIRIRRGFNIRTLSDFFHISTASAGKIFLYWINVMFNKLGKRFSWPHRNILIGNTPKDIAHKYSNMLGSIFCTKFTIETPSLLIRQSQCYSNYKGVTTLKSLIMTDNNGAMIYVSALVNGNISDKEVIVKTGFVDILKRKLQDNEILPHDTILADVDVSVSSLIDDTFINIKIPTFRLSEAQLTTEELEWTRKIGQERMQVEKAIGRLKKYYIFSKKIPMSLSSSMERIYSVCCALSTCRNRVIY